MQRIYLALLLLISSFFFINIAQAEVPASELSQNSSIAPLLKETMPAVVNIVVQGELPQITDPFLKRELEKNGKGLQIDGNKFVALGSGVITNAQQGYIVTNAHVVDSAKSVIVTLNDGRRFLAKEIGSDDAYDIAVLQIHASHLNALPFANSNSLQVGDFVAAIGSPFGLNQTVTSGIVSALHRSDLGLEGFENFIQTDAPINSGNSGGALINMQGQLVGINTAILAPSGGNVGIGFAIPSNIVKSLTEQLIKYGKVERGLLGVQVQTLAPNLADAFNLPNQKGAVVTQVLPYSPAAKAGLRVGDIITKANDVSIDSSPQIHNIVGLMRTGASLNLDVLRDDKAMQLTATIENAKDSNIALRMANPYLYGVTTRNVVAFNPAFGEIRGAQVAGVDYDSPAWISDLRIGDIIVSANGRMINNVGQLEKMAKSSKNGLLLNVLRGSGSFFLVIE